MTELYQQRPGIETATLQTDAVLFDETTNRFCVLNSTGSFIWSKLETPTSVAGLAHAIVNNFRNVTIDTALKDVESTLEQLESLTLAVPAGQEGLNHA